MDGVLVDDEAMVGAGSLVPPGMTVPARHLALGVPARIKRELTPEELTFLAQSAENYVRLATRHLKSF